LFEENEKMINLISKERIDNIQAGRILQKLKTQD
jgi:hypothetical protein